MDAELVTSILCVNFIFEEIQEQYRSPGIRFLVKELKVLEYML